MTDVTQCSDLQSLQVLVCFILCLMSSARLASAHSYLGLACSATLRLGLHFRSNHNASFSVAHRHIRRMLFWVVIKLDMYASSVLGFPTFMHLQEVDPAIDLTLKSAYDDIEANDGTPDGLVRLKASAKHLELLRIIRRAIETLFPQPAAESSDHVRGDRISVSLKQFTEVEADFQTWAQSISTIFPQDKSADYSR